MKAFFYPPTKTLTSITNLKISDQKWEDICKEAHKFGLLFVSFNNSWDKFKSLNNQGAYLAKILLKINKSKGYDLYALPSYLGDFVLDFFVNINSNERFAKKHNLMNLLSGIHYQYDTSTYYKLGYMLGNYLKHHSKTLPISAVNNENGTKTYLNIKSLLISNWKWKNKEQSVLKKLDHISIYNLVKNLLIILFMQSKYLGMDLFYQHKESLLSQFYINIYSKYIVKFGYPSIIYKDKSTPYKFHIKTHFDHLSYDFVKTVKIINKLGLDKIKIKIKKIK